MTPPEPPTTRELVDMTAAAIAMSRALINQDRDGAADIYIPMDTADRMRLAITLATLLGHIAEAGDLWDYLIGLGTE